MVTTITDGTEVSTVRRTNLVRNPLPESTIGWVVSTGDALTFVADDNGAPCLQMLDASGAGSVYADPSTGRPTPSAGQWVAFAVDVKGMDATSAASMRLRINGYDGTTVAGGTTAQAVTTTSFTRLVVTAQATTGGGYVRTLIWPTNSTPTTGGARFRRAVAAVAATEAEAIAAVSMYFDGSTPPAPSLSYAWIGDPGASPSVEIETPPRSTPDLVLSAVQGTTARTLTHDVLDAEGPDVTLRPAGLRAGEHRLFYLERAAAQDAYLMHREAHRFTMTDYQNPFNDMIYVATGRLELEELVEYGRWVVTVGYQEVATW